MNDILSLASGVTNSSTIDFLGYVAIPLLIAVIAGAWALIKGVLRFTQFMARSEAAQRSIADSNVEIRDKLVETRDQMAEFAEKTNERLGNHDSELAVLKYAMDTDRANGNGHTTTTPPVRRRTVKRPIGNMDEAENA